MRPFLFFIVLSLHFLNMNAQTVHPHFLDGVVYARQDTNNSSLQLDPYVPGSNAYLDSLILEHGIDTIAGTLQNAPSFYRIEFSDSSEVDQLVQALQSANTFDLAEKMPYFQATYDPNDPRYPQQWSLSKVNAPKAWDSSKGDSSVRIAIVDNAVSTGHEDLKAAMWDNSDEMDGNSLDDDLNGYPDDKHGYDVADQDGDPDPPSGSGSNSAWVHGTHVGGIAGASTDNGMGIASVGHDAKLIAVKCSENSSGGSALTHAYEGVDYAIQVGADVINMSFGSYSNTKVGEVLLQEARSKGIALMGAAGNDDSTGVHYPAGHSQVMAIGATNSSDEKAFFSNYGNWIDVMAPGTSIESSLSGGSGDQYGALNGTSMATPLVSGVAALVLSADPNITPSELEQLIEDGATDISDKNPSYSGQLGSGRVDAYNAVSTALGIRSKGAMSPDLRVRPQPNNGRFELTGVPRGAERYRLNGQDGRLIRKGPLSPPYDRFSFTELQDGVYYLWIYGMDPGSYTYTKVVIAR